MPEKTPVPAGTALQVVLLFLVVVLGAANWLQGARAREAAEAALKEARAASTAAAAAEEAAVRAAAQAGELRADLDVLSQYQIDLLLANRQYEQAREQDAA